MQILLCAATEFEIAPTIEVLKGNAELSKNVTVLITGVGMLPATYELTKAVLTEKPGMIVQAGLAGCLDENIPLGTTAAVLRETVGDLGVLQNSTFDSVFDMGLIKPNEHPWNGAKLQNPNEELLKNTGLILIDSVTVNEISTNEDRISYYKNGLEAGIESMEGAALHYVGLMENIPFLQLRALSNYVGERDKSKWVLDKAIEILNLELQRQLLKLL
jgi:futalosine hydrolase